MEKKKIINKILYIILILSLILNVLLSLKLCSNSNKENECESQEKSSDESISNSESISESTSEYVDDNTIYSIYLSDIGYVEELSSVGWGSIQTNKNVEGKTIQLQVDGNPVTFSKGYGAHATSTLVFDVSEYSKTYTHFTGRFGVDYSKANNGDGILFTISISYDGTNFENKIVTEALKGYSESYLIDLDITNVKYIKLYANQNTSNGYDHAVYGNIRISLPDYDVFNETYSTIKTVEEYDLLLSQNDIEYNYENNKKLILEREFVNRFGYETIKEVALTNVDSKNAINWLFNDVNNLELFIEGGNLLNGNASNVLLSLGKLYKEYKSDLNTLIYKKMIFATALSTSKVITTFISQYGGNNNISDPVIKYARFKYLYDNDKFLYKEQFTNLNMELIRLVMDARMQDEEITWLNEYASNRYPDNLLARLNGYSYINYASPNMANAKYYDLENKETYKEKYHLDYGNDTRLLDSYGTSGNLRLWMMMDCGCVCWGISGTGTNVNEVFGIPATNMYQPGHDAYLLYKQDENGNGLWEIWNNISGWQNSYTRWGNNQNYEVRIPLGWGCKSYNNFNKNNGSYMLLSQAAFNRYDDFKKSMYYNFIANSYKSDSVNKEKAYNKAISNLEFNLDSFDGLIETYVENQVDETKWLELATQVSNNFKYYPLPMVELLNRIKENVSSIEVISQIDMLKINTLNKASQATEKDVLQSGACRDVANSLLNSSDTINLASFSFSGDNANTIVIDSSYDSYNFMVKYSLDGGITFNSTNKHQITLSKEDLEKINSTDDIIVGIVGASQTYTIDILDGTSIETSGNNRVFLNDNENKFFGNLNNLEYSVDNGNTYNLLIESKTFEGDINVLIRYKAHDNYLCGEAKEFTFNKEIIDNTKVYITKDNISFVSSSSNQSGQDGSKALDKDPTTLFHTKWSYKDPDRYFIVSFVDELYLSKITYWSSSQNGRLKYADIYVSLDGIEYTLVQTSQELANNTNIQIIELDESVKAKYVKIVAKETYGNSVNESTMYFSASEIEFYEDKTK